MTDDHYRRRFAIAVFVVFAECHSLLRPQSFCIVLAMVFFTVIDPKFVVIEAVVVIAAVVVVVEAVSPTRGPGDVKTPRNTGATPLGASTKLRGAAERSQKSADERPP